MSRALPILAAVAALAAAAPASADLRPVERSGPRIVAGTVRVPAGHAQGLVTVIVRMPLPPLAQARSRALASARSAQRLDVASRASRAYLARLARAQAAAVAELRRALPDARVSYRFGVVLDGFTVTLPERSLPRLARMSFATRLYPSLQYTQASSPGADMIGATALQHLTGADGRGMKIAVVDTGVDISNPYLSPAGFSYPPGFPRGARRWTSPKVIVARVFPGPGAGKKGRLPFDATEPHGTHVAGIAAGDAGTNAPAGGDHPAVSGLSGVAPRAWIGNYRVFTIPTPLGHVADTPQIVAAFEAAVKDGMNVINFSGGGPQVDPANDALVQAIRNVAAAGVVPVIAAGNDRDDYGYGTVGSPATAPDAISVAAVSGTHDYMPAATVTAAGAPADLRQIPVALGGGGRLPGAWGTSDQKLVDVGSIVGSDGRPVDRQACGPPSDPNGRATTLPAHALVGAIALAWRGGCTFDAKAEHLAAAGAIGILLVDNRPGEPNPIPVALRLPAAMVADLDGARLHAFMAAGGGRTSVRIGDAVQDIVTGRGDTITSFSSAGPTDFGHQLKPDLAAPGGQILSSTPPLTTGSTFAVFDGTSMATPHVAGAAALVLELHPTWTTEEVKSALVSTAGPAWGDTAQTTEASVLLEGGGLVNLPAATDPRVLTDPTSLSFGDLDVDRAAQRKPLLLSLADAGGGAGDWQVAVQPQAATAGAALETSGSVALAPGGFATVAVTATAAANAAAGWDYGFVVLRQGAITRRVPYAFFVTRPQLPYDAAPAPLLKRQRGDTRHGVSRVSVYCCPTAPFGLPPSYTGPAMKESGAEHVYVTHVNFAVANAGVSILESSPGSRIDPWYLGSLDEGDVQGYTGTPVNVNDLMSDAKVDVGAAGVEFPRQREFFVAVDSGSDPFTGRPLPGTYLLNSWVNDVTPPRVRLLTTRLSAGRPTIVARVTDGQSGVDPLSLTLSYGGVLVGASAYDPLTGIALFPLAGIESPPLATGVRRATVVASDYQETKNVDTYGPSTMPNTTYRRVAIRVVAGPTATWLAPAPNACVGGRVRLEAVAGSTARVREVRFLDGRRTVAVKRTPAPGGLYEAVWRAGGRGRHVLRAVVLDAKGRSAAAARVVRTGCG